MSERVSLLRLCEQVDSYLDGCYPELNGCFKFAMDVSDEGISFPDYDETFITELAAMSYLLDTGLPVWVIGESGYPYEVLTYSKLELLFDL